MAVKYDLFGGYGEIESLSKRQLQDIHRKYAKRFNQRIVESQKQGFEIKGTAVNYLSRVGRRRFSESKTFTEKMSIDQLRQEVWLLNKALSSKQTTVTGRKQIEQSIAKAFRDRNIELSKSAMNTFLNNLGRLKDGAKINYNIYINAVEHISGALGSKLSSDDIKDIADMFAGADNPLQYADEIARKYPTINSDELRRALAKW